MNWDNPVGIDEGLPFPEDRYREWPNTRGMQYTGVGIPNTWLPLRYYQAYNMLYRMENGLRVFVYMILKKTFQENWWREPLFSFEQDAKPSLSVKSVAGKLEKQSAAFPDITPRVPCPLMLFTLGELAALILSEKCWPSFAKYFHNNKERTAALLREITEVRNALAHFREIPRQAISRLADNLQILLSEVDPLLTSLFKEIDPVTKRDNPRKGVRSWEPIDAPMLCSAAVAQQSGQWTILDLHLKWPVFKMSAAAASMEATVGYLTPDKLLANANALKGKLRCLFDCSEPFHMMLMSIQYHQQRVLLIIKVNYFHIYLFGSLAVGNQRFDSLPLTIYLPSVDS